MFANRFTVIVDACALVPALSRNLLLSLAAAEFFRVKWSPRILTEVQQAIAAQMTKRGVADAMATAARARRAMERAFLDAMVSGHEALIDTLQDLPDPNDAHVIAAAIKVGASVIVTENLRHFPRQILDPHFIEAKTVDAFVADTIDLDIARALSAIRQMRMRFKKPEKSAEMLLNDMQTAGLMQTASTLRDHASAL